MCFGGPPPPATIVQADTGAYDRLAQQQLDAMRMAQDSAVQLKQGELNQAVVRQQEVLSQLREAKTAAANDTAANAARMAALIGAPPPEKSAKAPVMGSDRAAQSRPTGKRGLRIDRQTVPDTVASGAGLNIPGGY